MCCTVRRIRIAAGSNPWGFPPWSEGGSSFSSASLRRQSCLSSTGACSALSFPWVQRECSFSNLMRTFMFARAQSFDTDRLSETVIFEDKFPLEHQRATRVSSPAIFSTWVCLSDETIQRLDHGTTVTAWRLTIGSIVTARGDNRRDWHAEEWWKSNDHPWHASVITSPGAYEVLSDVWHTRNLTCLKP